MKDIQDAVDSVISTKPVEFDPRQRLVTPITSTESLVASRGLVKHLEVLYQGVFKRSNEEKALLAVHNFLADDVNRFRRQSFNLGLTLNEERSKPSGSRARSSMVIGYLLFGQQSHKTGVWLKGAAAEQRLINSFHQILESDDLTFYEYDEWAGKRIVENLAYWNRQLEQVRGTAMAADLRQAIDRSTPTPIEV